MIGRQLEHGAERSRREHLAGRARSMIEQRLPAWSQRTARREFVIDDSVHTTRSSIGCDSSAATPSAGTDATTAR